MAKLKLTRAKWSGPTPSSKLCSGHFKLECFEPVASLQHSFGMKFKSLLKPDAVPTVFLRSDKAKKKPEIQRGALEKLQRKRV